MFALVYAYNQTAVEYRPPEIFANQTIPILDRFLDGSLVARDMGDHCAPFAGLAGVSWMLDQMQGVGIVGCFSITCA